MAFERSNVHAFEGACVSERAIIMGAVSSGLVTLEGSPFGHELTSSLPNRFLFYQAHRERAGKVIGWAKLCRWSGEQPVKLDGVLG